MSSRKQERVEDGYYFLSNRYPVSFRFCANLTARNVNPDSRLALDQYLQPKERDIEKRDIAIKIDRGCK